MALTYERVSLVCVLYQTNQILKHNYVFWVSEYAYTMRVTKAGNVYSFGVILLEVLIGKTAVSEGFELVNCVSIESEEKHNYDQMLLLVGHHQPLETRH